MEQAGTPWDSASWLSWASKEVKMDLNAREGINFKQTAAGDIE